MHIQTHYYQEAVIEWNLIDLQKSEDNLIYTL